MTDQNARDLAGVTEDLTAPTVTELTEAEMASVTGGIYSEVEFAN